MLYWRNGFTAGSGTLANAIVETAGLRNLAAELGIKGSFQMPLETLLTGAPDILISDWDNARGDALAEAILRHPALQKRFAGRSKVSIPAKRWVCGLPFVAGVIDRLREVRLRP